MSASLSTPVHAEELLELGAAVEALTRRAQAARQQEVLEQLRLLFMPIDEAFRCSAAAEARVRWSAGRSAP